MTASLIRHTRAGGSSFVGMLLLTACSAALSAPVCGTGEICLDFNDNLMPSGWGVYFNANGPGRNVRIANGRLEVGQVDTYGGIYKPLDMTGVTKLSVEYDGNIAPVYWGQATATMLLQSVTNGAANFGAGYVMTTGAKNGFGTNAMNFGLSYQPTPANGGAVVASSSGNLAPQYGAFHFASTFQDGFASLRVTDSAGAQVWSTNGNVALPGFTLASMPNLGLFGVTTTGASAWIDNVKISGLTKPPPSVASLANLAEDVYGKPEDTFSTGNFRLLNQYVNTDGFKANVYLDQTSNQVVIAIRGTNTTGPAKAALYNALADGAMQPHALADDMLIQYGRELANVIKDTQASILTGSNGFSTGASITLTGHSMGGALAELMGAATGIASTGFDAPGAKDVLSSFTTALAADIGTIRTLGARLPPAGPLEPLTVRLQGDQVSYIGYKNPLFTGQLGKVISIESPFLVKQAVTPNDITTKFHNMETLRVQLNSDPPVATYDGYPLFEVNILGRIVRELAGTCTGPSYGAVAFCYTVRIDAGVAEALVDPGPGNDYYLLADAGSPFMRFIELPELDGISGWKLRYQDQYGWSEFTSIMGIADFDFTTDVIGVEFIPLNSLGEQTYNPDWFAYLLRLASPGEFSATQIETGAVPEPTSLALVLAAIGGLGLAHRSSARRIRNRQLH